MKKFLLIIASFLVLSWGQTVKAQAFTFISGQKTYNENFDGMAATGTTFIPGWSAVRYAGTGTIGQALTIAVVAAGSNSGTVYNAGTVGSDERAFGTLASGSTIPRFGTSFVNNTGASISQINLTGEMEQWRSGSVNTVTEICAFEYSTDATDLLTGTWTPITNFDLVEKILTSTAAASLDGNLPENKTALSATLAGLNWTTGNTLWIRWSDINDGGSDGLYCIDNLSMTVLNAVATPTITITSPVTGNEWAQGSTHNLTWTSAGTNATLKIEYTGNASDGTPTWSTVNEMEVVNASAGTYAVQVPVDLPVSTDSKFRITDIPQTATALSNTFSITAAAAPVATFNPVNAATGIAKTSDITITFNVPVRNLDNSEITDANVASLLTLTTIDASGTAVLYTATIDAAKKVITINPDADLAYEQLYYVAVAPVEGLSDNATVAQHITFTTAASLAPAITDVTITEVAPYYAGDVITFQWVSKNVLNVKIEVWIPSESKWEILFPTTPSDGTETFTIPIDAQYSTEYKLRVSDVATPTLTAESSTFTIIGALSEVSIAETAPYYAGDAITIKWKSHNVTNVMIEVWSPGDNKWDILIASTLSDGSEAFTIPAEVAYSTGYKIRVTDVANTSVTAESSAFAIIAVAKNLVSLRVQPAGAMVKYTGIATVTFSRPTTAGRNQKYIQDATAAVLIDDPTVAPGFITGTYNIGDGITNIVGKITLYGLLVEFTPLFTTGEPATGIVIVPEVRTLASLTSADQCKLVKIENFAFKSPRKFVKSTTYAIDGFDSLSMAYRTIFAESDYIGGQAPVGPISSVCLVGQYNAQMQITARSWTDMVTPTVAAFTAIPTFVIEGESIQFTDKSTNNPTSWEWSFVGGTPATSAVQNPLIQYNADGLYSVTLKTTNAFGNNTVTKTDYVTVGGVGFSILPSNITVYPNPSNGRLFITNPAKDSQEVAIFNALGKQVNSTVSARDIISLDITAQTKGLYLLRITNKATKSVQFKKIILN